MKPTTKLFAITSTAALGVALLTHTGDAVACGCFAPPLPSPEEANFAVNQQAEQIIFEVEDGTVSAHVRIFYEGDPAEFAWLLPMPNVPDLALSNGLLFGLVDEQTTPITGGTTQNLCPDQQYICRAHPPCPSPQAQGGYNAAGGVAYAADPSASESVPVGAGDSAGMAAPPPVVVLAQERIGSYETITFAADEADLAIGWLNDNGFIINETMSPYMQPYLDSGMVFLASRLVPGAEVDEIRPLKLTYQAESASIPLQLTAIAAEPHMMVTAFIYSNSEFDPLAEPLTEVPAEQLSITGNYGLVLARAVDDAGGNAFVKEYVGAGPVFTDNTGCCSQGYDWCYVGGDSLCQCPGTDFDSADCSEAEELGEAINTAQELSEKYTTLTRLTTRVSPEEMVFNPEFVPSREPAGLMRLRLTGTNYTLASCEAQVIEQEQYQEVVDVQAACADTYCDYGECVVTSFGAGCACGEGFVARSFTDIDGSPALTCVPEKGTVDFAAGGLELPDACAGIEVSNGVCVDIGGFPAVACEEGRAAVLGPLGAFPGCVEIELASGDPGARNFTIALQELDVCAPPPPACVADGWLEERPVTKLGVDCGDGPDASWFEIPPAPDCSAATSEVPVEVAEVSDPAIDTGVANTSTPTPAQPTGPVETTAPRPEVQAQAATVDDAADDNSSDATPSAGDDSDSADSDSADDDSADDDSADDDSSDADAADAGAGANDSSSDDGGFCGVASLGGSSQTQAPWAWLLAAIAPLAARRRRRPA